jgi:HD superfamily phosphohydrolase
MIYEDSVYGPVQIEEKVLLELIQTKAMERLKGVNQGGPLVLLKNNHEIANYRTTRFEHSVGVCLLLKKFNASLEEQIAGLLHDISHTVFSHATDFIFNRGVQQDYHEKFYEKMIMNSDIPNILKKHNIDINSILNIENFTLLETELPDLCADRIDYFLRDMCIYDNVIKEKHNEILNALTVFDGELIFKNKEMAKLFAEKYIKVNTRFYCNAFQATLFKLISDVLKQAIQKNIIIESDLFTTDSEVLNKLTKSKDKDISNILNTISYLNVVEDRENYAYHLKSKVRCTDPKILIDSKAVRLSKIDEDYKKSMKDFVSNASNGFFVRIIRK